MKAKRIVAWLLVCVLQLGICLLIPLHGRMREQQMEREGESYRFALRAVRRNWDADSSEVILDFPPPAPFTGEPKDTVWQMIEADKDGLARVVEKAVTFEEAKQLEQSQPFHELPLYSVWQNATLLADDDVFRDLDALADLTEQVREYKQYHPDYPFSDPELEYLGMLRDVIRNADLRALAQKQIDTEDGDVLPDSYVTGILYNGTIYYQEVFVAGIHAASIHN
ncbi:MAG: hypothetical protein II621_02370 [Clostridia bacterium]|nr:hypothetical protein [Clostridia bacterium]